MKDKKADVNKKPNGSLKVNISADEDKIKYYECNCDNCIFEILNNDTHNEPNNFIELEDNDNECNEEFEFLEDKNDYDIEENSEFKDGRIIVKSIIDYGKREVLSGVKINLYEINGLSPVLIKSDITDKRGKVIFKNIQEGNYRVIEIIDKKYFEKPKYVNWNEIIINRRNREKKILIVNRIKSCRN